MPYKNLEIAGPNPVYQQAPQTNHFYKGFSTVDPTTGGVNLYDFSLIQQDILNHFNTRRGERVMNPTFGSIIWELMMEPLTDQVRQALVNDVTAICKFDPRVIPTVINITEYPSGYLLDLTLTLRNTDQSVTMKLAFDQKIGLVAQ
jgi:phage baseplate assembly protein W